MTENGAQARGARRGRVLVIDDEPFVAHALAIFIGDENDVTIANDAREALRRLDGGAAFDVILCDVMMPNVSGIDFHRELASSRPTDAQRVIFITGGAITQDARAYLASVSNECIDKPPDPFALRALVRRRVAAELAREAKVVGSV